MTSNRLRIGCAVLALAIAPLLTACQEEIHSAQWYMGHGNELQAKLAECKKYPSLKGDQNCRNATEAFVTIISASAQKNP